MARKVEGRTGDKDIHLPFGWVLDGDDQVVIPDVEWDLILADTSVLNRLDDLGTVSDGLIDEVPTFRDIQRVTADPLLGGVTETEFDAHLADTTAVHGIANTALLETITGAQAKVDTHANRMDNPHAVTKAQVGLSLVDNTTDASKPISTATSTALAAKADLVGGLVPSAQIPAIAITDVTVVASQAAMLALTAQKGDVAVRSDVTKTFMLSTNSPTTLADWIELPTPGTVISVNGHVGVVVLAKSDIGLALVDNTADLDKPISTDTQDALDLKADLVDGYVHYEQLPPDIGTGSGAVFVEDPDDPGTYLISGGVIEDPDDPGTYLIGA